MLFYLRRDLHDMAQFLETDESEQPENWLSFDWRLAEDRTWEMFLSVADKTRVELSTFNERLGKSWRLHGGRNYRAWYLGM